MKTTTVSRTAHCEDCAAKGRPKHNDLFVVHGGSHQEMYIDRCDGGVSGKLYGFTPHLFTVLDRDKDTVTVQKVCGMNHCGVSIQRSKDGEGFHFSYIRATEVTMTLAEWNALVLYKDQNYHI